MFVLTTYGTRKAVRTSPALNADAATSICEMYHTTGREGSVSLRRLRLIGKVGSENYCSMVISSATGIRKERALGGRLFPIRNIMAMVSDVTPNRAAIFRRASEMSSI